MEIAGILLIFLGMPGTFSILAGSFLYALLTDFSSIGWKLLLIFVFLSVFAELSDNLLAMLGAKKIRRLKGKYMGSAYRSCSRCSYWRYGRSCNRFSHRRLYRRSCFSDCVGIFKT